VIIECPVSQKEGDFKLTVEREGKKFKVEITLSGISELELRQPLREGERASSTLLLTTVNGEKRKVKELPFDNGTVKVTGLNPEQTYSVSYWVESPKDSLLAPNLKTGKQKLIFKVPVFFKKGSYRLTREALITLREIKPVTKVCKVKVVGYADKTKIVRAKVSSNKELAKRRALSVKNYLEDK
jgi:outer membrane protein OmpA-like peptidoglycan-associated protein